MDRVDAVTGGLFVAWLAHDVEELLTMAASSRTAAAQLADQIPPNVRDRLPATIRDGLTQRQVEIAIGIMGVGFAAVSVRGWMTRGRAPSYQMLLTGYGVHGLVHLASAAASRGYVSGVATTPVFVLPFWWAAERVLRTSGVTPRRHWWTLAAYPPVALACCGIARRLAPGRPGEDERQPVPN